MVAEQEIAAVVDEHSKRELSTHYMRCSSSSDLKAVALTPQSK
jgi:hypothetical protein